MPKAIRKKKKFIDPKNERAQTFALIHRSQRDPLAADDDAPQRLLQVIRESVPDQNENNSSENEKRKQIKDQKEEERKYGVFYDDDYNYMQHLKIPENDWTEIRRTGEFLQDVARATKSPGKPSDDGKSLTQTKIEKSVKVKQILKCDKNMRCYRKTSLEN